MFKTILVASAVSTMFLAAGRTTYSGLQIQTPIGTAFKMTPDPSNIWSFHETYQITTTGKHSIPVLVDFDGNGKMDTEIQGVRVLITDVSIRRGEYAQDQAHCLRELAIVDSKGGRWAPLFTGYVVGTRVMAQYGDHLQTPIALPINSELKIEFTSNISNSGGVSNDVQIHLIGRLVTL